MSLSIASSKKSVDYATILPTLLDQSDSLHVIKYSIRCDIYISYTTHACMATKVNVVKLSCHMTCYSVAGLRGLTSQERATSDALEDKLTDEWMAHQWQTGLGI